MDNLIALSTVERALVFAGWRVKKFSSARGFTTLECFAPNHEGPDAVWSNGCQYSAATRNISDGPGLGYGHNDWFNGPWHYGYVQRNDFGIQKLKEAGIEF
jgi:hypothetical protein